MSRAIAVVIDTADPERTAEALRAAVGLTLRGDAVTVVSRFELPEQPGIARAVATLEALGHRVTVGDPTAAIAASGAVEVWTGPEACGPRTIALRGGPAPALAGGRSLVYDDLDAAALVELIFAADAVVVH